MILPTKLLLPPAKLLLYVHAELVLCYFLIELYYLLLWSAAIRAFKKVSHHRRAKFETTSTTPLIHLWNVDPSSIKPHFDSRPRQSPPAIHTIEWGMAVTWATQIQSECNGDEVPNRRWIRCCCRQVLVGNLHGLGQHATTSENWFIEQWSVD